MPRVYTAKPDRHAGLCSLQGYTRRKEPALQPGSSDSEINPEESKLDDSMHPWKQARICFLEVSPQ